MRQGEIPPNVFVDLHLALEPHTTEEIYDLSGHPVFQVVDTDTEGVF